MLDAFVPPPAPSYIMKTAESWNLNAQAPCCRRFAHDGWSMLDAFVVLLSLVALGPIELPVTVLRLLRAFRVVRLFGRPASTVNGHYWAIA
jgi:hypothetical protein